MATIKKKKKNTTITSDGDQKNMELSHIAGERMKWCHTKKSNVSIS